MFSNAFDLIYSKINSWIESAINMFPNFIVSVIILLLFFLAAKYIKKWFKRGFDKIYGASAVINLFSNVVYLSILATGLFVALGILKLDKAVTSLLAGVGIVGLALGFAFQEIAANFISGIILSVNKPFVMGDIIEVNDNFGIVENLSLRTTSIRTFQGQKLLIPNKIIFQNTITNYTENGKRRIDLKVGVSYGDDLEKVQKVTIDAINGLDDIIKEEEVQFFFTEFADSSINFVVMFWTDYLRAHSEYMQAQHKAIMAISKAFKENDISIPFPIRTLDFGIKGGEKLSEMINKKPPTSDKNDDGGK